MYRNYRLNRFFSSKNLNWMIYISLLLSLCYLTLADDDWHLLKLSCLDRTTVVRVCQASSINTFFWRES